METLIELRRDPTYAELRAELLLLRAAILLCPLGPGEGMEINFAGQRVALTWEARARYEAHAQALEERIKLAELRRSMAAGGPRGGDSNATPTIHELSSSRQFIKSISIGIARARQWQRG